MKKIIAILSIFLLLPFENSITLASFSDVISSHDNSDAIEYMQAQKIVQGYQDGTFKPDQTINAFDYSGFNRHTEWRV